MSEIVTSREVLGLVTPRDELKCCIICPRQLRPQPGPQKIALATAARVLEAVRALGYRPNADARALKLGSAEMLGLIIPQNINPFYAQFAQSVEEAADERGYKLLSPTQADPLPKNAGACEASSPGRLNAIPLASVASEPDFPYLMSADVPIVLLNQRKL